MTPSPSAPGSLVLADERTGAAWQVWPAAEPIPAGAVAETRSYLFRLECPDAAAAASAELLLDGLPLEALRARCPTQALWRWNPGFHAGSVQLRLALPARRPIDIELVVDPDRRKMLRADFDRMILEILEDTTALFALAPFRTPLSRAAGGRRPPIARLELLRSRIDELERVTAAIAEAPRRRLHGESRVLPVHLAARVRGDEIVASLRGGRPVKVSADVALPEGLRRMLPARIRTRRARSTLDLDEHRRMAACLASWRSWLIAVAGLLERDHGREPDKESETQAGIWARRCRVMARRLDTMRGLPPFAEASAGEPRLEMTSIFRSVPAYRDFFRIWRDLNGGLAQVFGDFVDMPLARTYELYELWCFLRLVRATALEFPGAGIDMAGLFSRTAQGGIELAAGQARISFDSGWELCFQRRYREFWISEDGCGSFSRTLVPDITLHGTSRPAVLIVLDAKYRIESALDDALSSIHTYRDALVQQIEEGLPARVVRAAYLLAPAVGTASGPDWKSMAMPARLFSPGYRSEFRFGAVLLVPGMPLSEVREILRALLRDADAPSMAPAAAAIPVPPGTPSTSGGMV